ncbi:MAG: hypothetical protein FWD13_13095 [Treponema sp.]|nr:hypothetical protein [Treponema sp.]
MDNLKYRIISKIGLLIVIIGFFMPISCNLNGFELAKAFETFGGVSIISILLYSVFIFSCIGFLLLLLLMKNIFYNIIYDWINLIIIIAAIISLFVLSRYDQNMLFENNKHLQSGAYIMLFGLVISAIPIIFITFKGNNTTAVSQNIVNNTSTNYVHINNPPTEPSLTNNEKVIFDLTSNKHFLIMDYIIEKTSLNYVEATEALESMKIKNVLIEIKLKSKEKIYYFYVSDNKTFDLEFVSLMNEYDIKTLKKIYEKITGGTDTYSDSYIGKIHYMYINKFGTEKEWNKEELEFIKFDDKMGSRFTKVVTPLSILGIIGFITGVIVAIVYKDGLTFWFGYIFFLPFIIYFIIHFSIRRYKINRKFMNRWMGKKQKPV